MGHNPQTKKAGFANIKQRANESLMSLEEALAQIAKELKAKDEQSKGGTNV